MNNTQIIDKVIAIAKTQGARAELLVKMLEGCDEYPLLKKLILQELTTMVLEATEQLSVLEKELVNRTKNPKIGTHDDQHDLFEGV